MKRITLFCLLIMSANVFAYVDLSLQYSFAKRRVEGIAADGSTVVPGDAISTTEVKAVNWAWYIWDYTALELNYSESTQRLVDDRQVVSTDGSYTITEASSTVVTTVQGIGIKQSFANRKARFIPSLSIGYAKMTTSGESKFLLDVSGTEIEIKQEQDKQSFSSSYATFQLRFRLTQYIGLTLGAKTVMPDFKTEEADKNVTYSAGFSWVF